MRLLKRAAQGAMARLGYTIVKLEKTLPVDSTGGLNVLELVVDRLVGERGASSLFLMQFGANDGMQEDPVRRLLERHRIPALLCEPLPDAFTRLQSAYAAFDHVVVKRCAAGSVSGELDLYRLPVENHGSDRSLVSSFDRSHVEKYGLSWNVPPERVIQERVPCRTVQDLLEETRHGRVDIAVMDTEGMDHLICEQFLDLHQPPAVIHFEYCNSPVESVRALMSRFERDGYRFVRGGLDVTAAKSVV